MFSIFVKLKFIKIQVNHKTKLKLQSATFSFVEQLISSAESQNCPPTEVDSLASEANLISSITPATKATTWWAILEERVTEDTGKGSSLFAVLFNSNQQL